MGYLFYWNLTPKPFREAHPFPDDSSTVRPKGGHLIKFGTTEGGQTVKIFEVGGTFHFCTVNPQGFVSRLRACELRVLEAYMLEIFQGSGLLPEPWKEPHPGSRYE